MQARGAGGGRTNGSQCVCLLLLVIALAAGCTKPPAKQLEAAEAWAATTRELAIQRRVDGVGRAYAEQLLSAGRRDVRKLARSIDPFRLPPDTRARVPAALARLDTLMERTGGAVRRGDAVALGLDAAAVAALGDTLRALRARVGGP